MKRIICTVFLLAMLISLLALPVLAGPVYEDTITRDFGPFYNIVKDDTNRCVQLTYMDPGMNPYAVTMVVIPSGATGRAFTYLGYHGLDGRSNSSNVVEDGVITCRVILSNWNMASKTQHYANRTVNGDTTVWNYYVVDHTHDPNITSVDMLRINQESAS